MRTMDIINTNQGIMSMDIKSILFDWIIHLDLFISIASRDFGIFSKVQITQSPKTRLLTS
jgi:hypothetical protein